MISTLYHKKKEVKVDLSKPIKIGLDLNNGANNPNCFYAPNPEFSPLVAGDFIGSTEKGSPVNFYNITLNPHGNGTHTECVGHISKEKYYIKDCLKTYHFWAKLITVPPETLDDVNKVITLKSLEEKINIEDDCTAIVIRTLPNNLNKNKQNYSGENPPYFEYKALEYLRNIGINHLLTDLPSVDKEQDGGKLLGHKAFWNYPENPKINNTITELIFIENNIEDGYYFLNIQIANLELDASPSNPTLYPIIL